MVKRQRKLDGLSCCVVPRELIQRIALFVADSATFFSYLRAFVTADVLGDLEHFLWLRRWLPNEIVWPYFGFREIPPQRMLPVLRTIADKYQFAIQLDFGDENDISWLEPAFQPQTLILSKLPEHVSSFDHIFTMSRLRTLTLSCVEPHVISLLLKCVRESNLTALTFGPTSALLSPPDIEHLVYWLANQPVRRLAWSGWRFHVERDPDVLQTLYQALFDCRTLQDVKIDATLLVALEQFAFYTPLTMHSLVLTQCGLPSSALATLAAGLPGSNLHTLVLQQRKWASVDHMPSIHAFREFAAALPKTKLQKIVLHGFLVGDRGCWHLRKALPLTRTLTHLDLTSCHITDAGAALLGAALHEAPTALWRLILSYNYISSDGVTRLIQAMGSSTCPRPTLIVKAATRLYYWMPVIKDAIQNHPKVNVITTQLAISNLMPKEPKLWIF
ncbi:unnamed protein product [Aphanomyces euteiches]